MLASRVMLVSVIIPKCVFDSFSEFYYVQWQNIKKSDAKHTLCNNNTTKSQQKSVKIKIHVYGI